MTARSSLCKACLVMLIWMYAEVDSYNVVYRINDALKNETALQFYVKCFLDKGPCSVDARLMKRLIPVFVSTSCKKCSLQHKQISCRIVSTLQQEKYSDLWHEFLIKYDPKEMYRTNLTTFVNVCSDDSKSHEP